MASSGGSQTSTVQQQLDPAIQSRLEPFLAKADTALGTAYQPYTGSRVAAFTPDQNTAFQTVRGVANSGTGVLGTATDWMRQAATKDTSATAIPFFSAANSVSAAQSAQPYFNAAGNLAARSAGTPYFQAALMDSSLTRASPMLAAGANTDAAGAANPLVSQGVNASSAGAANPYLTAGTTGFTANAADYMSPYTSGVVDEIARRGTRNLTENLLPAVNQTFTGAGQFGSSRNSDFNARAVRDANESILGQQAQALESGYKTAADIYGQDAARQLQAGQTAGQLTSADASRAVEGGLGLGSLTNQNALRQIQAGQTTGQLSAADLDRQMRAGEAQIGAVNADANRQMQMGQTFGQLTDADQNRTIGIGNALAGYAGTDAARQLQAANALASSAQQGQAMNYANAAALQGIGQQQQALNQANLDTAYGDFREQRGYPQDQLNWYSSLLRGTPQASSQTSTAPGPSAVSQLGGLGLTGLSLIGATGGFGNGGWFSGLFREGGMVGKPRKMARGGLAHYAAGGMTDDDDDIMGLTPNLSPASMAAERGYRDAIKGLLDKYETPQRSDFEKWLPGLTGGLGLLAGQSSNPWANLAQSGMGALQMYGQQRKEDRSDRQAADKLRVDLAKADLDTALKRDALAAKSASPWVFPGMERPSAAPSAAMPSGTPTPAAKVSQAIPDYEQYAPFINAAAQKFGVDPSVIRGVIAMESSGDPNAVSPKGAMGAMQLMPGTYEEMAKKYGLGADARDPENNILAGTAYLAEMRDRYGGDLAKALAAYNAGPGGFEKAGGNFSALPAETQGYLRKAAGLGLVDPASFGAPVRAQVADAGGWVRPINRKTGQLAEFEVDPKTGAQRPYQAPTELDRLLDMAGIAKGDPRRAEFAMQILQGKGKPPQTTVNISDNSFGKQFGEEAAKQIAADRSAAVSGADSVRTAGRIEDLLDSGAITGTFAENRASFEKALATLGLIDGKRVTNTEQLVSALAGNVLSRAADLKGVLSDKDMELLKNAASGSISLTPDTLREVARLSRVSGERAINRYNDVAKSVMESTEIPDLVKRTYRPIDMPERQAAKPAAQPANQGAGAPVKWVIRDGKLVRE